MSYIELEVEVIVGGVDVTSYVVSVERQHSICDVMSTGRLELSHVYGTTIDPYDTIVIHEMGTKVFTGYVTNVVKERLPANYYVEFSDTAIRLVDYWLDTLYESTGETAEYWIGFFCDLAGVSYTFDVTYDNIIPDDYEWQYTSCMEIIRQLIMIGGFYLYSDPDGVLHFSTMKIGNGPENLSTGSNIVSFHKQSSITPTRNKAVVFGKVPITASVTTTVSELSDVTKTAVVASPYVETESYATDLANRILQHFSQLGDVKTVDVLPNPSFRVGQEVSVTESWTGYNEDCLITSMRSSISDAGYIMSLILDEFCPFIWGYFQAVTVTIYSSTDGDGVWRSDNLGLNWYDITGNIPSGDSRYVRGISASGDVVWAASLGGVYVTYSGGYTWENKTPTIPSGVTLTDWTDVEIDPGDVNTVFVLMDDLTNNRVYMHRTGNDGATWTNVEVA